jgi:hypothetical protein
MMVSDVCPHTHKYEKFIKIDKQQDFGPINLDVSERKLYGGGEGYDKFSYTLSLTVFLDGR